MVTSPPAQPARGTARSLTGADLPFAGALLLCPLGLGTLMSVIVYCHADRHRL
jgi:hypothetical protein